MQKQLFGDVPEDKRAELLRDNMDGLEGVTYMKVFSSEELAVFKDQLSETEINKSLIQEKKSEANAEFKNQLAPLKDLHKKLLSNIRLKSEEVREDCHKFIDHTERMVGFYNSKGELVASRPIRPNEMQANIFSFNKTGTND